MEQTGEKFSTGITLFVNGIMISGEMIHPVAYFKGMGELLETQPDEGANQVGAAMSKAVDVITKESARPKEGNNNKEADVIYLKDITLWNSPIRLPVERSFLVLSIDAVDGFMWGNPSFPIMDSEI
jgi:hypothetical protein